MISARLPTTTVSAEPLTDDGSDCDLSEMNDFPTIELSSRAEVVASAVGIISRSDENDYWHSPMVIAEQLPTSMRDADLEGLSTRFGGYFNLRAEFISATFVKSTADTFLGVKLGKGDDTTIVAIARKGPIHESPLRVGDKLLSVNNKPCNGMTSVEVCKFMKELVGSVTLVAHNEGGASDVVESMMTKNSPDELLGVTLRTDPETTKISISYVCRSRDIVDSLLNIGDEVLSINNVSCEHLSLNEAKSIISAAPKTVSIKAITLRETGVVVAELSTHQLDEPIDESAANVSSQVNNQRPATSATANAGGQQRAADPLARYQERTSPQQFQVAQKHLKVIISVATFLLFIGVCIYGYTWVNSIDDR